MDTASEYEEVSVQYNGFSPKIGRFGNEAAMTTNLRQQPPQRLERGIIPIPKGTVKLRRPMLRTGDTGDPPQADIYHAILTVGLMPYTSEIVEICVISHLLDADSIAIIGDPSGDVCADLGHITHKETLFIPMARGKHKSNEDVALLSSACVNDPCTLNIDRETMIRESVKTGTFFFIELVSTWPSKYQTAGCESSIKQSRL